MNIAGDGRLTKGFCIFIDALFEGRVPGVSDTEHYVVFATKRDAQIEIADNMISRIQEFINGERDYDDATTVQEFVVPVVVSSDGTLVDERGNQFRRSVE